LILLLAGVIYGKGTGFSGLIAVVEGQTWVDAEANYDGTIRAGRFFGGEFTGIGLRLRDFGSDFLRTGQPMDFVSRVDLLEPDGSLIRREDIRVNHPARIEGLWIHQSSFGWAPVIEVTDGGETVASGPVVMDRDPAPEGVPEFAMPWRGVVKLPGAAADGLDRAIELELWPDSRALTALLAGQDPQAMLVEFDPIIRFSVWEGTLTDLSTNRLDTTGLDEVSSGILGAGRTVDLADGAALSEGKWAATRGCPWCWPPLSSCSWGSFPRCTALGARSGSVQIPTATGRCCAWAASRCSANRSSKRSSTAC
jgi:cytochrome c biogenesis protein